MGSFTTPAKGSSYFKNIGTIVLDVAQRRRLRLSLIALGFLFVLGALLLEIVAGPVWLPYLQASGASPLSPQIILVLFLGALFCEFIDASLGMGYGTTLTPILLLSGFNPLEVVPAVLVSQLAGGALASYMHHRDDNVNYSTNKQARNSVILLSSLSAVGAIVAVLVAVEIPKEWLTGFIGVICVCMGLINLLLGSRKFRYSPGRLVAIGTLAAFNKGLSGGGYGPLVASGQIISGLPAKQAVGITATAEAVTCLIGFAAYLYSGQIQYLIALPLVLGALLSVPLATLTIRWLPESRLKRIVGVATLLLGLLVLVKTLN